jgi:hypothetical protein
MPRRLTIANADDFCNEKCTMEAIHNNLLRLILLPAQALLSWNSPFISIHTAQFKIGHLCVFCKLLFCFTLVNTSEYFERRLINDEIVK